MAQCIHAHELRLEQEKLSNRNRYYLNDVNFLKEGSQGEYSADNEEDDVTYSSSSKKLAKIARYDSNDGIVNYDLNRAHYLKDQIQYWKAGMDALT